MALGAGGPHAILGPDWSRTVLGQPAESCHGVSPMAALQKWDRMPPKKNNCLVFLAVNLAAVAFVG